MSHASRLPPPRGDVDEPLPLFAYGTLARVELARNLLERRVRGVQARLPGFTKIRFEGFDHPTVLQSEDDEVTGVLYRGLTQEDYPRLDAYEGVHEGLYQRIRVEVQAEDGDDLEPAYVYLATEKTIERATGRGPAPVSSESR